MLKIDLGCGHMKQDGFVGVDRFPLPAVDVIADLNFALPFADDSVDLLLASHSLEHAADLMATMREVYRICRHGAQICIVAPYNEQKLSLANPYHVGVFNEHTPRFWSDFRHVAIDPAEYEHPHALDWGLASSDNSDAGLDLRLVRIEFFYFPQYRDLPVAQQRVLRRERLDVCDQVMYHLCVWKGDEGADGRAFAIQAAGMRLFEPDAVRRRKESERESLVERSKVLRDEALRQVEMLREQQVERDLDHAEALAALRRQVDAREMRIEQVSRERDDYGSQLQGLRKEIARKDGAIARFSEIAVRHEGLVGELERANLHLREARSDHARLLARLEQSGQAQMASQGELAECLARLGAAANDSRRVRDLERDLERAARESHDSRLAEQSLRSQLAGQLTRAALVSDELADCRGSLGRAEAENAALRSQLEDLRTQLQRLTAQLDNEILTARDALRSAEAEVAELAAALTSTRVENVDLGRQLVVVRDEAAKRVQVLEAELDASDGMLAWYESKEATWSAEMERRDVEAAAARRIEMLWPVARDTVGKLFQQVGVQRASLRARVAMLVASRDPMWDAVSPAFAALKAYSATHFRRSPRDRLVLGEDLRYMPFNEYLIPWRCERLAMVTLAVHPLLPASHGWVGVEIVAPGRGVVGEAKVPLTSVSADAPCDFMFAAPLEDLASGWGLRVFVSDSDVALAVFELARYSLLDSQPRRMPFAALA